MTLEEEFKIRNDALVAACRRLSSAVMVTDCELRVQVAGLLANVALTLASAVSWQTKANAAGDLRDLLHKESFTERPAPSGYPSWYSDLCTLMEHATLYEEPCYGVLRDREGEDAK